MPLDQECQEKKCARCRHAIQSDPACDEHLWFHRACLEEGHRALQRAQALAARFGGVPADVRTSAEPRGPAAARLRTREARRAPRRDQRAERESS